MKKATLLSVLLGAIMTVSFALPTAALAGHGSSGDGTGTDQIHVETAKDMNMLFKIENPLGSKNGTLMDFIANVLDAVVLLLSPVVVIMMLYSGLQFVLARGNTEKLGPAKQSLMYTLIGAAIVLGAKGLALVIQNTVICLGGGPGC